MISINTKIETLSMSNLGKNLKDEEVPQDRYKANPCSNPKAKAKGKRIT